MSPVKGTWPRQTNRNRIIFCRSPISVGRTPDGPIFKHLEHLKFLCELPVLLDSTLAHKEEAAWNQAFGTFGKNAIMNSEWGKAMFGCIATSNIG